MRSRTFSGICRRRSNPEEPASGTARMNRILECDNKRNHALVEPGVSYIDYW
jgi:hypothetical protein